MTADDEAVSSNIVIGSTAPKTATTDDELLGVVSRLMFTKPGEDEAEVDKEEIERDRSRDLARLMQTELQRLGCYRMGVDGMWGPGSRGAFTNYLKETRQSADTLDPSLHWYNRLILESGRICRAPAPIKRQPEPQVARRSDPKASAPAAAPKKSQSFRQRAVKGQTRQAKEARREQRKNALPPDISMGVGIGL